MTSPLIDPLLETIVQYRDWSGELILKGGELPAVNTNGTVATMPGWDRIVGSELEVELLRIRGDRKVQHFDYEVNGKGYHVTLSKDGQETVLRAHRTMLSQEFHPINANGDQPNQVRSFHVHEDAWMIEFFLNGFGDAILVGFVTASDNGARHFSIDMVGVGDLSASKYNELESFQRGHVFRAFVRKVIHESFPATGTEG